MKTLVTGVTGRFGPHLVRELLAHGHEVALFCRHAPADEFGGLEWIRGDINNAEECCAALRGRGFDAVHNAAAMPYPTDYPGSEGYDDDTLFPLTMQTNIIGLYNMLQASLRGGVGIFVHTSSNCALGHGYRITDKPFEIKYLPIDEAHPTDVEDSYSLSKLVGEQLLESYARVYGLRCYALRSAGIKDAAQRADMRASAKPARRWSEWLFPWTASEDLAYAHRLMMERARDIEPFAAYFCQNDDTDVAEPTMELIRTFRPDLLPLIREPLDGHASLISNKRLKEAVGWRPLESWRA